MENVATPLCLTRIESRRNMARFYTLSVEPTLFGDFALARHWGRIGTVGRVRLDLYANINDALAARDRILMCKRKRGYQDNAGN